MCLQEVLKLTKTKKNSHFSIQKKKKQNKRKTKNEID